jgi:hypothetical protein
MVVFFDVIDGSGGVPAVGIRLLPLDTGILEAAQELE